LRWDIKLKNNLLPFISIVIASFNRKDIIEESIKSTLNQQYKEDRFEVILVDNNSSDGTIEEVNKLFKKEINNRKLKIVSLNYNSGSSGSCIEAIKFLDSRWEYVLKMDEDIVLDSKCLIEMINAAKTSIYDGMIGGKVFFYKNRKKIHAVGSHLSPWFAISKGIGVNKSDNEVYQNIKTLDGVSGCMVLIPRSIYEKVGWFDNDYFLYYDDHDLMYKSLKKGFRHIFNPKAIGYHDTSTGNKRKYANSKWLYYSTRGSLLFLNKNFKKYSIQYFIYLLSHNCKFIFGLFFILFYSKIFNYKINLHYYFLGYFHGLKNITGYYNIDTKKLNILLISGGSGGLQLGNGIYNYSKKFNQNFSITHLINAYDDGKSTGAIREFFKSKILGPSDIRKIHENIYKNHYSNKSIIDFFKIRINIDIDFNKILKQITTKTNLFESNDTNIKYFLNAFNNLPMEIKKLNIIAINHYLKFETINFSYNDFSYANLIYASLADFYGSMQIAEEKIRNALNLPSKVVLNSDVNGFIFALTENGTLLHNEEKIVNYDQLSPIYEVFYKKEPLTKNDITKFNSLLNFEEKKFYLKQKSDSLPIISEIASKSLLDADIIIFSPGTQHSSLYPTYFTKNLCKILSKTNAMKFFITNIIEDNEIPKFSASDQIRQAVYYLNEKNKMSFKENQLIDIIISNKPPDNNDKYLSINLKSLEQLNLKKYIIEKVEKTNDVNKKGIHDENKIVSLIFDSYNSKWK